MMKDTINVDKLTRIKIQKIQVYGQEMFWTRIMLIKRKKSYCMLRNHCYESKIYVNASLSCKEIYSNKQSFAPTIKLKAKSYSESQPNGMLYPNDLKTHSTLKELNKLGKFISKEKNKKYYSYLNLQSLYIEKSCTTFIQR